jgi:hypothetical protein
LLKSGYVARESGIDLLLSGSGGDFLFDGDLLAFAEDLLQGHPIRGIRGALRLRGVPQLDTPVARFSALLIRPVIQHVFPSFRRFVHRARARRRIRDDHRWAGPALRAWLDRQLWTSGRPPTRSETGNELLDIREAFQLASLATGCRFAQPYLDDQLIAFIRGLPKHLLFHDDFRRGLFRFAFRSRLPDSVRLREGKAGFGSALAEVFLAAGGEKLIAPLFKMTHLADLGFIEPRAFRARLARFIENPSEPSQWLIVWPALAIEAFLTDLDTKRTSEHHFRARTGCCP